MPRRRSTFDPSLIDNHTPLRLADAVTAAFPSGGMSVSGLRLEAARGRLQIARIAGKDFVILASIKEMIATCRVQAKAPDYGSDLHARTGTKPPIGSSSTTADKLALDLALASAKRLKDGSPTTSPANTHRNVSNIHNLKSE